MRHLPEASSGAGTRAVNALVTGQTQAGGLSCPWGPCVSAGPSQRTGHLALVSFLTDAAVENRSADTERTVCIRRGDVATLKGHQRSEKNGRPLKGGPRRNLQE